MKFLYILLAFLCIGCNPEKEQIITPMVVVVITSPAQFESYYEKPFRYYDEINPYKTLPIVFKAYVKPKGDITWSSNIDGYLGTGPEITVAKLSVGTHIIEATCLKESASLTITILEVPIEKQEKIKYKETKAYAINDQGKTLLIDYDNNIIVDSNKNLMWMKSLDSYVYTWTEALQYSQSFSYAGYSNWRLPTLAELSDISHLQGPQAVLHKEFSCNDGACWTSTPLSTYPDDAYVVKYTPDVFDKCAAEATFLNKDNKLNIRLVRDIK